MQYDQKQFTQKGLDMFSSALSNKAPITVDKVIVDDLPTNNFSNLGLLSLDSFADAMSFQANYTETSNNTLTVDAVMSNKGFQSPYTVQEIGLVGHVGDDTNGQSLMAILVASDPFTLPAQQNDETPSQFIPNITIQLANNDMGQVPVLVQDDAYIAQKDLDKLVANNGYIKLTDADNRYVKQGDFQNEVNNSVNEKADKSDLSNLQSNINNDIQPQLNSKANQSDLNTTNGSVSSLQSNKADKGDVNGQINQTLSQATSHSDQNLSTANNHSDSNYNDLSNKNNILSNSIDEHILNNHVHYDAINILDGFTLVGEEGTYSTEPNVWYKGYSGYGPNQNFFFGVPIKQNKTYYLSVDVYVENNNDGFEIALSNKNYPVSIPQKYTKNISTNPSSPTQITGVINGNDGASAMGALVNRPNGQVPYFKNFMIIETNDDFSKLNENNYKSYIPPFDIVNNNTKQLSNDYQAPNLAPLINDNNIDGINSKWSIPVENGKTYYLSCYVNYKQGNNDGGGFTSAWYPYQQLEFVQNNKSSNNNLLIQKYVADRTGDMPLGFNYGIPGTTGYDISKICITQSDSYVPFEVAQRNKIWNDRITNKTNDLSNQTTQQFNQANSEIRQKANQADLNNTNNSVSDSNAKNISPIDHLYSWTGDWYYPYNFYAEQGKTYYLSAYFTNIKSGNACIYSVDANGMSSWSWNGGSSDQIPSGQNGTYIAKWNATKTGNVAFGFGQCEADVFSICITQSERYVGYDIAKSGAQTNFSRTFDGQLSNGTNLINFHLPTITSLQSGMYLLQGVDLSTFDFNSGLGQDPNYRNFTGVIQVMALPKYQTFFILYSSAGSMYIGQPYAAWNKIG